MMTHKIANGLEKADRKRKLEEEKSGAKAQEEQEKEEDAEEVSKKGQTVPGGAKRSTR